MSTHKNQMQKNQINPLISVVTVVLNGEDRLEKTIKSVINQTYKNIEYIIIDGGSTDGSVDIIKKYGDQIDLWISEPDNGIYDAMNKGIALANGEWINFMNAGDRFSGADTVARIIESTQKQDIDVLYGDSLEHFASGRSRVHHAKMLEDLWKGMICSHQAMLVRSTVLKDRLFNSALSITADYDLLSDLCHNKKNFRILPMLIVHTQADGYSDLKNIELTRQQWQIARKFWGSALSWKLDSYYLVLLMTISINNILKKVLPKKLSEYLRTKIS